MAQTIESYDGPMTEVQVEMGDYVTVDSFIFPALGSVHHIGLQFIFL